MATGPELVETVKDLTELATLSMQAMVIFDDFDDKVAGKDDLLRRMALTKEQIEATLQGLREIVNATHTARDQSLSGGCFASHSWCARAVRKLTILCRFCDSSSPTCRLRTEWQPSSWLRGN